MDNDYYLELKNEFDKEKNTFFKEITKKPSLAKVEDLVNANRCYIVDAIYHNSSNQIFEIVANDKENAIIIVKDILARDYGLHHEEIEFFIDWLQSYDYDKDPSNFTNIIDSTTLEKIKDLMLDTELCENDHDDLFNHIDELGILSELTYEYRFDCVCNSHRFEVNKSMNTDRLDLIVELSEELDAGIDPWDDLTIQMNEMYATSVVDIIENINKEEL